MHAFKAHTYTKQSILDATFDLLTCLSPHTGCRTGGLWFQLRCDAASSVFHAVKRDTVARLSTLCLFCFLDSAALMHPVSFLFSCVRAAFAQSLLSVVGRATPIPRQTEINTAPASGCRVSWSGLNFFLLLFRSL